MNWGAGALWSWEGSVWSWEGSVWSWERFRVVVGGVPCGRGRVACRIVRYDGRVSEAPAADGLQIGATVGNYVVEAKIGEGGMGAVYLAAHPLLGRKAAVKVLLPEHSKRSDLVTRFFNEAKTAASLRHPALVEVFDFGFLPNGSGYLVMDYLEGESLAARLERVAPLPPDGAAEVARQIANGVAAAHGQGIVHRDLKPDNVFLVPDAELAGHERVKILDFGIAKLVLPNSAGSKGATSTGMLLGTPLFMAPEQCRGAGQVDHRADIYSVGCILYMMLTARPPFNHEGVGEILAAHLHEPVTPPRAIDATIPEALEAITLRALAKKPDERYQTMVDLAAALTTFLYPGGLATASMPVTARVSTSGARLAAPSASSPLPQAPSRTGPTIGHAATRLSQPMPTTLSSAAGAPAPHGPPAAAVPARKGRGGGLIVLVVLLLGGAAAGGFYFQRQRTRPAPRPTAAAGHAGTPPVVAGRQPEIARPPAAEGPAGAAGQESPAQASAGSEGQEPAGAAGQEPAAQDPAGSAGQAPAAEPPAAAAGGEEADVGPAASPAPEHEPAPAGRAGGGAAAGPRPVARKPPAERKPSAGSAIFQRAVDLQGRGDEAQALRAFSAALREGGLSAEDQTFAERQLISLRRKFGEIEVVCELRGATVAIDGRYVGRTPLPEPLLVRPGTRRLLISGPGYRPIDRAVQVEAGQKALFRCR
jgi:eukaryotic-like serine/threonine-protein kinase